MSTLADRLRKALAEATPPRTQAELARACGLKGPSVSNWVTGTTQTLKAESAILAADFLGVRPRWLIEGVGPMRHAAPASTSPPADPTLEQALAVVLGRLPGLDGYTADKVLGAMRAAIEVKAPLEHVERDLLQWLQEPRPASSGKRQNAA